MRRPTPRARGAYKVVSAEASGSAACRFWLESNPLARRSSRVKDEDLETFLRKRGFSKPETEKVAFIQFRNCRNCRSVLLERRRAVTMSLPRLMPNPPPHGPAFAE